MRAVNLLPSDAPGHQEPSVVTTPTVTIAASAIAAIVAIALAVVYISDRGGVNDKRDQLTAIQQQIVDIQVETARTEAVQSSDQARLAAFTSAAAGRVPWDVLLDDISRVLPAGSWLSSMNMQGGTAAAAADASTVPTAFTVSGIALTQNTVAQVLDRLALVPMLTNVTLQTSSNTTFGTTPAYQFTLSANVRLTEVAQ